MMKKPSGYWKDIVNVRTELDAIIDKLGGLMNPKNGSENSCHTLGGSLS